MGGGIGGVAIDNLGYVYVSDFGSNVWRIDQSGEVKLLSDQIYASSGNAIDGQGDLLQASHFNGSLYKISRSGEFSTVVAGKLNGPVGVAVSPTGDIYVTNCWSANIARINANSHEVTVFSEEQQYRCPNGLTFDPDGNLFIVDFSNTVITKIKPDGSASVFATLPGQGNSHIAFRRGYFYVTQIYEHRIFRVSVDGTYKVFVGDGTPGQKDGVGTQAQIAFPNGIAISPRTGDLYINVVEGRFRDRESQSQLHMKIIKLPTLRRTLATAFNAGGAPALRSALNLYVSTNSVEAPKGALMSGLSDSVSRFIGWGQLDLALAVAKLNSEIHPNSWEPSVNIGDAQVAKANSEQARHYYEKALAISPQEIQILSRIEELKLIGKAEL